MGSNVSRHSGKGLSGRRAQSSGSLCKILAPKMGRVFNPCGDGGVRSRDRNRFCGSLPNHLDEKEVQSGVCTPDTLYSNYGDLYRHAQAKNVDLLFQKLLPQNDSNDDDGYDSRWAAKNDLTTPVSSEPTYARLVRRSSQISFITKENTFEARFEKGSRGLGLSVTGGVETADHHPGLIRIKRIFPHQPAWECGVLRVGDIILEANGTPLTGLTNHEALEVLRTTPSNVVLKVCRPPRDVFPPLLPDPGEPPPPPKRDPSQHIPLSSQSSNSSSTLPMPLVSAGPFGEFDVILKKVNGSLGFTLRKEDESVLGHYVRSLVREPAISDGRIRPGDKIVSVNGTDISPMSHEEAVVFLRNCGEEVRLKMYRDAAQTPVSALSPTETHKTFRPKPALRKEAMDMLCDLAVRKLNQSDSSNSSGSRSRLRGSNSPGSSPRRRKLTKTPTDSLDRRGSKPEAAEKGSLKKEKLYSEVEKGRTVADAFEESFWKDSPSEPTSMPPITSSPEFTHKNPIYQSAYPLIRAEEKEDADSRRRHSDEENGLKTGSQGLLKWKGIVFTADEGGVIRGKETSGSGQVLTVELTRGWNSRLGFSLQNSAGGTLISAIYPDSVAAKDGRLRLGDQVVMINDEPTEDMTTSDIIDLLRKVRGTIAITVVRSRKSSLDGTTRSTS